MSASADMKRKKYNPEINTMHAYNRINHRHKKFRFDFSIETVEIYFVFTGIL